MTYALPPSLFNTHSSSCQQNYHATTLLLIKQWYNNPIGAWLEFDIKKMNLLLWLPPSFLLGSAFHWIVVDAFVQPNNAGMIRAARTTSSSWLRMMMDMEVVECDVAIVGGGPAGCTCALYTSRADLKTVILDKNPAVGALAITSHIANYPGVDRSMTGMELLDQMRKQAIAYGTDYRRSQVFMIDIEENADSEETTKVVYTPDVVVRARSLVLATGAMGRATPPYPGEEEYLGKGVSYCATCE